MPSPRERHRNNIRMGVFVSVALLLALGVVIALTDAVDRFTTRTERYTVEFSLRSGVSNLAPGSEVRVGGMRLGEVVEVRPRFKPGEPFEHIDVAFKLDRRVTLFNEAQILVTGPLIGAEAWLDIPSVGDPSLGRPDANHLIGRERAGMMTTFLGADNAEKTDEMIESVRQFTSFLSNVPRDYEDRVLPIMDNINAMTADAHQLVARINHEDWPSWKLAADEIIAWANRATNALDAMMAEGHALLGDARGVVGDNRERIERTVANLAAASDDVRELVAWTNAEGVEKIIALLDTGHSALVHTDAAIETIRRDYDRWATDIGFAMANSNLASQQLKLAMTEIRRAPWKLIHTPSRQELEHELLYDAVRGFAIAAADLRSASESIQRVLENHGERLASDEEAMERLKRNLFDPLERYEEAQKRLLDVLLEN